MSAGQAARGASRRNGNAAAAAATATTVVTIPVDVPVVPGLEESAATVKSTLEAIAPFVAEAIVTRQDEVFRAVVDAIIETTPIRKLDAMRAELEQRAIAAIFSGTEWLTAEQLGRSRAPDARNPHAAANRWRNDGKLFAISKGGTQYFARYAFDEAYDPLPVIAEVIEVMPGLSAYRLASWFESTNSYLGGRRPRDCLRDDPTAVVAAAREHMRVAAHG